MAEKYSAEYWNSELQRARTKREERFFKTAEASIKVYEGHCDGFDDVQRRLSVWWYINQTLLPAYYSRIPKVEVDLKKKSGSEIYQLTARAIEAFTQGGLDEFMRFHSVAYDGALSFLLTGQCVFWNRYEADVKKKIYNKALILGEDKKLTYGDGTPFQGDETQVQDKEGEYSIDEEGDYKEGERSIIECVNHTDFLTSLARNEDEIEWKSRRAYLSKEEVLDKFGSKVAEKIEYTCYPEDVHEGKHEDKHVYDGKADFNEVWCEVSGKVYWVKTGGEKSICEEGKPPLSFKDFYPCSVMSSGTTPNSIIPVADYEHCKDQVLEVEQLTTRIFGCLRAVRANFAYDATCTELSQLLSGDLKGVPVKNWPNFKQRAGLAGMMEFLPVEQYIRSLEVLSTQRNEALQHLYETTKASDILRGMADPRETATAVEIRADWGSMGLKVRQQLFARCLSEAVSKHGEVMCEHFDPDTLYQMADCDTLLAGKPPETWPQMVDIMREDTKRRYRISINSDSLVHLDERADRAERADCVASAGSFLNQSTPFIQEYPAAAPAIMGLTEYVVRGYKVGKEVEEPFKACMAAVIQAAQQKQAQASQQPPDPKMIEAQSRLQVAQIDMQLQQQKMQIQMSEIQANMQIKQQELMMALEKLRLEKMKMEVEVAKLQGDQAIKALEFNQEDKKIEAQLTKELLDTKQAQIQANGEDHAAK